MIPPNYKVSYIVLFVFPTFFVYLYSADVIVAFLLYFKVKFQSKNRKKKRNK